MLFAVHCLVTQHRQPLARRVVLVEFHTLGDFSQKNFVMQLPELIGLVLV